MQVPYSNGRGDLEIQLIWDQALRGGFAAVGWCSYVLGVSQTQHHSNDITGQACETY